MINNIPQDAKFLKVQLAIVTAQNAQLCEENTRLRANLDELMQQQRTTSGVNVENELRAFTLEADRDKMYEHLENLKLRYNKLHTAFLITMKRRKTLEEVFARQKTLPDLVKKAPKNSTGIGFEPPGNNEQSNGVQVAVLQESLEEAFDIIDELEFELESVDYLEIENERLKNELRKHTHKDEDLIRQNDDDQHDHPKRPYSSVCDECGNDGLPDVESIERSAITDSLIEAVETEAHLLRRDLLRSRLQNTRLHRRSGCPNPPRPQE